MKNSYRGICMAVLLGAFLCGTGSTYAGSCTADTTVVRYIDGEGVYTYTGHRSAGKVGTFKRQPEQPKYAFGVHVGVDIGAAAPWPPAHMRAGAMKMSAVPKLNPSLGVSFTGHLARRWSLTAELTYKQVGIDAEAWVSGQQFRMPNPDGEDFITRFRGTANVVMNFSM